MWRTKCLELKVGTLDLPRPDVAKVWHFGNILTDFGNFVTVLFDIWLKFEPTLGGNFSYYGASFQLCAWPNIKK